MVWTYGEDEYKDKNVRNVQGQGERRDQTEDGRME